MRMDCGLFTTRSPGKYILFPKENRHAYDQLFKLSEWEVISVYAQSMMPISTEPMTGDEIRQTLREHQSILAGRLASARWRCSVRLLEARRRPRVMSICWSSWIGRLGCSSYSPCRMNWELILGRRVDVGTV